MNVKFSKRNAKLLHVRHKKTIPQHNKFSSDKQPKVFRKKYQKTKQIVIFGVTLGYSACNEINFTKVKDTLIRKKKLE